MVSTNGAFQPCRQGAISGFKQNSKVQYAQLYINRTRSTSLTNSTNYSYAKTLILEPTQDTIRIQVYIDNTIIEAFANNGTSVVTARVYPQKSISNTVQLITNQRGTSVRFESYEMRSALEPSKDIFLDTRDVINSRTVLKAGYTDQPYCTKSSKNRLSCVVTISQGGEGSQGEHVASFYSDDNGITWQGPFTIEKPAHVDDGLPNAYAIVVRSMIEKSDKNFSRIFALYNLNYDNITKPIVSGRDDELGYFFLKFSDDGGVSWSDKRWKVQYPRTWIDRNNKPFSQLNMTTNIMWTVDHFKIVNNTAYFAFTKIGSYVQNPPEEIFVMASSDLLLEEGMKSDLSNVSWMMLPNEDHGIRSPLGFNSNSTVIEEGHVLPLSNGNMHIIARTSLGYVENISLYTHTQIDTYSVQVHRFDNS